MDDKCPKCGYELTDFFKKQITIEVQNEYKEKQDIKEKEYQKIIEEKELENINFKRKIEENEKIIEDRLREQIKLEDIKWKEEFSQKLQEQKNLVSKAETEKIILNNEIKNFETDKKQAIERAKQLALQDFKDKVDANNKLLLQEKDNKIVSLQKSIDDLKKKSEVGSQQAQGEAGEILIERSLISEFPLDEVLEVKKGQNGADIKLNVKNRMNRKLGLIYIESKYAKHFSESWIEKLKQDRLRVKADYALLVTYDLPENPNQYEGHGLYICGFHQYLMYIKLLRDTLYNMDLLKNKESNRLDKANQIYDYVLSPEFAQKMRNLLDLVSKERTQLEADKRYLETSFAKREKAISKKETTLNLIRGDFTELSDNENILNPKPSELLDYKN